MEGALDIPMLKVTQQKLDELELSYPGIRKTVYYFEAANIPVCIFCGSSDTAQVQGGLIGFTMTIAGCTTKFKLVANPAGLKPYFCNRCGSFYNKSAEQD